MPKKDLILNLPGFTIKKVTGLNPIYIEVTFRWKTRCVYCDSKQLRKKDSRMREVRHESIGLKQTVLRFKAYKFYCRCCLRYFNQRFPGILKYQRATEKFHQQVFHYHKEGVSQKSLAMHLKLGTTTIERWYHRAYQRDFQEIKNRHCPKVLGIDEHFFSKKQGYATTLCDLRKHKVFDVTQGRSHQSLESYFKKLPGKENAQVVCMDLSVTYRSLVKKYFPKAKIVADRFHVIRLINHMCMQTYQSIDPSLRYQRGLLGALRTNPENLKPKQIEKRNVYFALQPAVQAIYDFKQRLHQLLMRKQQMAKQCKKLFPLFLDLVEQLKHSIFQPLVTLGHTLAEWKEEIVRMWRFTKNNGITEGFHRKMKLIQRRAYGFRNFENYRLRVRVLCS